MVNNKKKKTIKENINNSNPFILSRRKSKRLKIGKEDTYIKTGVLKFEK